MAEAKGRSMKAVIDACVLAGTIRRHMVFLMADTGAFDPVWSPRIMFETRRAIPKTFAPGSVDKPEAHAEAVCRLMDETFPLACHTADLPDLEIALPDPDDVHVVQLAIGTGAKIIVTENLRDFPKKALEPLGLTAMNTDRFLTLCTQTEPQRLEIAADLLIQIVASPVFDREAMRARLRAVGLKSLAKLLAT